MHKNITTLSQIALYGGSFDPPHKGHKQIITNLLSIHFVHQVWILPCGDREDKKLLFSQNHRFGFVTDLVSSIDKGNKKVRVSDQEILLSKEKGRMIPTIQLLQVFQNKYPNNKFHFVIGSDILQTIKTWHNSTELTKSYNFIIFPRQGYPIPSASLLDSFCHYYMSSFSPPEISSTLIRKIITNKQMSKEQKKQRISQFVDKEIVQVLGDKGYL